MTSWTVSSPQRIDLDEEVTRLDVSLFGGRLNVVGSDGPPRVEVAAVGEVRVEVSLQDGRLSVRHERPNTWPGPFAPLWWWLNGRHKVGADVSIAVPYETAAVLRLTSGPVVVSSVRGELTVEC